MTSHVVSMVTECLNSLTFVQIFSELLSFAYDICIVGSFSWLVQYSLRHNPNNVITVTSKYKTL